MVALILGVLLAGATPAPAEGEDPRMLIGPMPLRVGMTKTEVARELEAYPSIRVTPLDSTWLLHDKRKDEEIGYMNFMNERVCSLARYWTRGPQTPETVARALFGALNAQGTNKWTDARVLTWLGQAPGGSHSSVNIVLSNGRRIEVIIGEITGELARVSVDVEENTGMYRCTEKTPAAQPRVEDLGPVFTPTPVPKKR